MGTQRERQPTAPAKTQGIHKGRKEKNRHEARSDKKQRLKRNSGEMYVVSTAYITGKKST
jgi:hypothetical protein